jgi:hypothetical protein
LKSSITWANWKVKIAVAEKKKGSQGFLFTGFVPTGWAPCCDTWLKFEVEVLRYREKKNELKKKNVWVVDYPVSWAPCCE